MARRALTRKDLLRKAHVIAARARLKAKASTDKRITSIYSALEGDKRFKGMMIHIDPDKERDTSLGCISTGVQEIDDLLTGSVDVDGETVYGSGFGIPRGRVVEVYGPESCLDKDTFVQYSVHTEEGQSNNKGGTIERLYERFHSLPWSGDGRGKYQREVTSDASYTAPCMNEEGRIFHNRIVDVVKTGKKSCFTVRTKSGLTIAATAEHKFYTGSKFVPLSSLKVGSVLSIHNGTPWRAEVAAERVHRPEWLVKEHPYAPIKYVTPVSARTANLKTYAYRRVRLSRAVVEADMNGLTLEEYRSRLNDGELRGLKFLRPDQHVHHLDEDATNDERSNLAVVTARDHGIHHAIERHNDLRFTVVEDEVVSIEPEGTRVTYDLRMESPFNNYVANGFVVHNSGKTSLLLLMIAEAQRKGEVAALVDVEKAFDSTYAMSLGVDVKRLLLSQPDSAEQALGIVELLVKKGVAVIGLDSVAALVPEKEIKGEMGDSHMGVHARLMSQALRKITGQLNQDSQSTVVFINQIRQKIGMVFGNPETTTGGNALKFYASIRIDVRTLHKLIRTKTKNRVTKKIAYGIRIRARTIKNKVATPFREVIYDLLFGAGIRVPTLEELSKSKEQAAAAKA